MSLCVAVFFFQAEDGIRDLVRSRGLGDVYKRQLTDRPGDRRVDRVGVGQVIHREAVLHGDGDRIDPVSYTHLTLPTSDLV